MIVLQVIAGICILTVFIGTARLAWYLLGNKGPRWLTRAEVRIRVWIIVQRIKRDIRRNVG